ncbi:MAG: phospholipid/cholesterol/gamma-HCH transport system substrate-binding protein [Thermoleophilaceae bacterium]|nr:phospholipid/cholesterol/gamma-HCH transport system substrate-binding protein [Thermoleophilaceae bacterium]
MTRGRGTASVVASPVLVGAVTTLIVIVSVFLAYNANKGLPFVPTYDLSARVPNGSNLVPGNEARVGGFRVGVVDTIKPATQVINGKTVPIAVLNMKLDKTVEPLPIDSKITIRSRSALGLKYVQITPGTQTKTFKAGGTVPLANATLPVEFDDFLNTFDGPTRQNSRFALSGYGDAFAGRGADLNRAIQGFNPFFKFLTPVMRNLSDPRTGLKDFFKNIGAVSAQVRPVSKVQANLFAKMADTFAAIGKCPSCLQDTISKNPPTLDVAIRSFRVQRPFLADFADLSRRLLPAARVLPTALPPLNSALAVGTRVLPQTVGLNNRTGDVFQAIDDLVKDPNTGLALKDLRDTLGVAKPLINYVAPFQTVCNGTTWFTTGLGQHQSEGVSNGTAERVLLKSDNNVQDNRFSALFNDRPADIPTGQDPTTAQTATGMPLQVAHAGPYWPAIDAQGNADCQGGQMGYIDGPLGQGRYPAHGPVPGDDPNNTQFSRQFAGGSHNVYQDNFPGLVGPTFVGIKNLKDVP